MIYLYSGTPGSGKSLHCARTIYFCLMRNEPVICNFEIDLTKVKHSEKFHFMDNSELEPDKLIQFSREYFGNKKVREGSITLVIDECQMMFNARTWDKKGREDWNKFFQMHRHFGYDIMMFKRRVVLDFSALPAFFVSNLLLVQCENHYFRRFIVSFNC